MASAPARRTEGSVAGGGAAPEPCSPPAAPGVGSAPASRSVLGAGYSSFILIGWSGVLVPSLVPSLERAYAQSDAGLALFYLLFALAYATGGVVGGALSDRLGRRVTLPLAAITLAVGLAGLGLAPAWLVVLASSAPFGLASGALDGGVNGLFLDLHAGRGGPLNLLHVFYSLGALGAPLAIAALLAVGAPWPTVILATAASAVLVGGYLKSVGLPQGRRHGERGVAAEPGDRRPLALTAPLVLLGLAIAAYVASAIGVSSWLVRFLSFTSAPIATAGLALLWGGQVAGRLLASRYADRFPPMALAALCASASGLAIIAAVLSPAVPLSIALFGLAGIAQGPVYPLIMVVGGALEPRRPDVVSGLLTAWGVVGRLVYPPLVGLVSVQFGIGVGMVGAGLLGIASAVAILAVRATAAPVAVALVSPTES